ncbi:MAG: methyltransferase [Candidatus Paceibacterota bacterium]
MEKNSVSHLSSYSISVFALGLFVGVLLDIFFPMRFMAEPLNQYIGLALVVMATLVIYYAEKHGEEYSNKRKSNSISSSNELLNGPYKYTRNPKYLGLSFLLIGLGLILNTPFIIGTSIVSGIIVNIYFIAREEALLEERHGEIYKEYKSKVRKWL